MRFRKIIFLLCCGISLSFFEPLNCHSATFDISFYNPDAGFKVSGFIFWLDSPGLSGVTVTKGPAIPPGWEDIPFPNPDPTDEYKFGMQEGFAVPPFNLQDGIICQIDYHAGTIQGFNLVQFLDIAGIDLVVPLRFFNVAGATFGVPIPSAIWLLGCGLIGLVGSRRKFGKH